MQDNVVKPLLKEYAAQDKLVKRLLDQQATNATDLKMLYSVIRTPRLCDQFHKTMQRMIAEDKSAAQAAKQVDVDTHLYLKDKIEKFPSEGAFLSNFVAQIERIH